MCESLLHFPFNSTTIDSQFNRQTQQIKNITFYLQNLTNIFQQRPHYLYIIIASIVLYSLYLWKFKIHQVYVQSKYDNRVKNFGNPLPSYPNGWYVACRSSDLKNGQTKSIDIAGQNIVLFKSYKGQLFALQAYCKHMGANIGIGGSVVNQKCIRCPFHGWLYDGETGDCVDYDGKPMKGRSIEYNEQLCKREGKLQWKQMLNEKIQLKKYPIDQKNNLIFIWIHAIEEKLLNPEYKIFDVMDFVKQNSLQYRGFTHHNIKSHMMDIPQNGADSLHFKYVHEYLLPFTNFVKMLWEHKWCRGDDPNLQKYMFSHQDASIHKWKQKIFHQYIKNYPNKNNLSVGNVDNCVKIPFMSKIPFLNITLIQLGPTFVYIFVKFKTHSIIFIQYLQPQYFFSTNLIHEGYVSWYVPYFLSAAMISGQGNQVTNDMYVWSAKKFARKLYSRDGHSSDNMIKEWRKWFSQYYEGTQQKNKKIMKQKNLLQW